MEWPWLARISRSPWSEVHQMRIIFKQLWLASGLVLKQRRTHFWAGFERACFSLPPSFSHTKYTGFWKRRTRTHFWAGFQQKPLLWTFGHNCLDVFEGVSSPSEPGMICWLMSESDGWPLCVLFIISMTKMLHWNYSCTLCLSCVTVKVKTRC